MKTLRSNETPHPWSIRVLGEWLATLSHDFLQSEIHERLMLTGLRNLCLLMCLQLSCEGVLSEQGFQYVTCMDTHLTLQHPIFCSNLRALSLRSLFALTDDDSFDDDCMSRILVNPYRAVRGLMATKPCHFCDARVGNPSSPGLPILCSYCDRAGHAWIPTGELNQRAHKAYRHVMACYQCTHIRSIIRGYNESGDMVLYYLGDVRAYLNLL
jgi:hypothetical protein